MSSLLLGKILNESAVFYVDIWFSLKKLINIVRNRVFFSDPRHLELTLATIFRPHNSYCVHVDHKSSVLFRSTVANLLECYRRKYPGSYIYPATMSYDVYWGHFSIVEADFLCMRDLLTNGRNWSYALNMAGSEVMLATNLELVNILSQEEGQRFSESAPMSEKRIKERISVKMNYENPENGKDFIQEMLDPPPHNMSLYKGGKSWLLPRQFLHFITHHPAIREFLGEKNQLEFHLWQGRFSSAEADLEVFIFIYRFSVLNIISFPS